VEVNLAEGHPQCQEHKQREDNIKHGCQLCAQLVKLWHIVERQVAHRTHRNGHR